MANEKISQLTNGNPAQGSDLVPIARSGANFSITAAAIAALAGGSGLRFAFNWHGANCTGNTGTLNPFGCTPSTSGDSLVVDPTASEPAYYQLQTGSSPNTQAQFYDNGNNAPHQQLITLGILVYSQYRVQLTSSTNQRVWLALTDSNSNTGNLVSDTPDQNMVGFRYSTNAGDTNWMAYCGTDSSHQTVVDTGVTPDGAGHIFSITYDSGTVTFLIDGTSVATISTNLPATSVKMQNAINVDNVNMANDIHLNVSFSQFATI